MKTIRQVKQPIPERLFINRAAELISEYGIKFEAVYFFDPNTVYTYCSPRPRLYHMDFLRYEFDSDQELTEDVLNEVDDLCMEMAAAEEMSTMMAIETVDAMPHVEVLFDDEDTHNDIAEELCANWR